MPAGGVAVLHVHLHDEDFLDGEVDRLSHCWCSDNLHCLGDSGILWDVDDRDLLLARDGLIYLLSKFSINTIIAGFSTIVVNQ